MTSRVIDVILATTNSTTGDPPPVRARTPLGPGIWIGKLPPDLGQAVLDACEPANFQFASHRTFGQRYAFVREDPPDPERLDWDLDQRLQTVLALSRLVRPTATGLAYSARIRLAADDTPTQIVAGPVRGMLAHAYVAQDDTRAWLTEEHAAHLRELLGVYDTIGDQLPLRLCRALWNHEFAACTRWIDVRWTIVTTALEALVNTDRDRATRQVTTRVPALAARAGIAFTKADASRAYALRSRVSHGGRLDADEPATDSLLTRLEDVLRGVLRVSILDAELRALFQDDERIRKLA